MLDIARGMLSNTKCPLLQCNGPTVCCFAVLIANELRSESVQRRFMEVFQSAFAIKKIPLSKLHVDYRHPSILLYMLKRRKKQ